MDKKEVKEKVEKVEEKTKEVAKEAGDKAKVVVDKASEATKSLISKTKQTAEKLGENADKIDKLIDEKRSSLGDYKSAVTVGVVGMAVVSAFMVPQVLIIGGAIALAVLSPKLIKKLEEKKKK